MIPGIPDKSNFGDLSELKPGTLAYLVVQKHDAKRAGTHYDIRLGTPETELFSWSSRKILPTVGDSPRLLIQQPVHAFSYKDYEGALPEGYGYGYVKKIYERQVLISKYDDNNLIITTADEKNPQRFLLTKNKEDNRKWLVVNITPTKSVPYKKVHYTKLPQDRINQFFSDQKNISSVQAKIDGAAALIVLKADGVDVYSYRVSKETGHPIIHTERIFGFIPKIPIPQKLVGTVLKGEIFAVDKYGRALPPQKLGGLLNSTVSKSLTDQKANGYSIKVMLYDVQKYGKTNVDFMETPYKKRRELLDDIIFALPRDKFILPIEAPSQDYLSFWKTIVTGKQPLTREGIVIHPELGKPFKAKQLIEEDVVIREIFKGTGKYSNAAGGFKYSLPGDDKILGAVGTGLDDALRKDLWENQEAYIGRVARIRSQGRFPSGAFRAPALIAIHEDYPNKYEELPKTAQAENLTVNPQGVLNSSLGLFIINFLQELIGNKFEIIGYGGGPLYFRMSNLERAKLNYLLADLWKTADINRLNKFIDGLLTTIGIREDQKPLARTMLANNIIPILQILERLGFPEISYGIFGAGGSYRLMAQNLNNLFYTQGLRASEDRKGALMEVTKLIMDEIRNTPYGDRGFLPAELYDILSTAAAENRLRWQGDPQMFKDDFFALLDQLAATRYALGEKGYELDISSLYLASEEMRKTLSSIFPAASPSSILEELKRRAYYKMYGAPTYMEYFYKNLREQGVKVPYYVLRGQDHIKKEYELYRNATESLYGQMAAVTARLVESGDIKQNTQAYKFWENLTQGYFEPMSMTEWLNMLSASGVSKERAKTMLSHKNTNMAYISTEIAHAVRALQPYEVEELQQMASRLYKDPEARKAYLDRLAAAMGYSWVEGAPIFKQTQMGEKMVERALTPFETMSYFSPKQLAERPDIYQKAMTESRKIVEQTPLPGGAVAAVEQVTRGLPWYVPMATLFGLTIEPAKVEPIKEEKQLEQEIIPIQ